MIKSIKLKNYATYNSHDEIISNCQKINFLYGANGSGKTTISNFLQNLGLSKYSDCKVEWESSTNEDILVYNREFRDKNFKENITGIFTLGESTIEKIEAIENKKNDLENKSKECISKEVSLSNKKKELQICENSFCNDAWDKILKQNEICFKEVFSGLRGNKDKFQKEVISQYKKSHSSSKIKTDLKNKAIGLLDSKPEKCNIINLSIEKSFCSIQSIEGNEIWSKVIVGNKDLPISRMIKLLDNADWVNKGRSYLNEKSICPFCQQRIITNDLKIQLNKFFSGEYENSINSIHIMISKYVLETNEIMSAIESIANNEGAISVGKINISDYNLLKDNLKTTFLSLLTKMRTKEKEVSNKTILNKSGEIINKILNIIFEANNKISAHNKVVDNYNYEKARLITDVWSLLMFEQKSFIEDYLKQTSDFKQAINGIQKSLNKSKNEQKQLEKCIAKLSKNVTSVQPTVDEINRLLKAYGFTNFKIVPSKSKTNAYQIQRIDGELAINTLSEGEETFISFLYFLQLSKGSIDEDKISSKKILVLDDPICSLDSTVLYIVSSMVKTLTKDIRDGKSDVSQIFILTHNVFFHKEASFIDGRTKELNDVNYWIIAKDNNVSTIRSFGKKNPIKTSYELLWQELKTNTNTSLITTQNIIRRIIENYFGILGKNIDDTIIDSFDTTEEKIICRSLISWINDGSHSIPDDLYIDSYTDSVERYKKIFKQIFVKMDHEAHYNMMMA